MRVHSSEVLQFYLRIISLFNEIFHSHLFLLHNMNICHLRGFFKFAELWLDLSREGSESLKKYILTTLIPNIFIHYGIQGKAMDQIKKIISWRFFDNGPETVGFLMNVIQRLISETRFESPFLETIKRLEKNRSTHLSNEMYAYVYHQSKTMDIRGALNLFGGASHTSDLLFLMGPTLFQQISRRKLSSYELRLCKRIRHYFSEFIRTGNPTPGRIFDAWHPFTSERNFIQVLGDVSLKNELSSIISHNIGDKLIFTSEWEKNSLEIQNLIHSQIRIVSSNTFDPYKLDAVNNSNYIGHLPKNYLDPNEYGYYNRLMKINSFWLDLLPILYQNQNLSDYSQSQSQNSHTLHYPTNESETGKKFKHAFFSTLILLCFMLVLLCICVIILKKNEGTINSSFL